MGRSIRSVPFIYPETAGKLLTGIVLVDQRSDAVIDIANRLAGVHPGYRQMCVPLDFLPIGFQFVFIPQFVEQSG